MPTPSYDIGSAYYYARPEDYGEYNMAVPGMAIAGAAAGGAGQPQQQSSDYFGGPIQLGGTPLYGSTGGAFQGMGGAGGGGGDVGL